ncbi:MAG TPA: cobalamin-binding protein [Ktedonobacterales bacterium]|nr:cobalamin-binding protein [Ktedonobacterales bacterium]
MRVVSLLASATEMIAALGCLDQMVGRSHECDYPEAVQALPVVSQVQIDINTSSTEIDAQVKALSRAARAQEENAAMKALSIYRIDIEQLQRLRPDIIFTQTQCEVCAVSERDVAQAVSQLIGIQPRIISLAPYRLADVWEDVLRVGAALERADQAKELVAGYQARLEELCRRTASMPEHPRVAVLEWLDPPMAGGNWTPELVEYAGGINLFGEVGAHSPWLAWEDLLAADPDVIILTPCGYTLQRTLEDVPLLEARPGWSSLRAVQSGRVFAIDGNQYFNRSGPRLVDSAEILATLLFGSDMAPDIDHASWKNISSTEKTFPAR